MVARVVLLVVVLATSNAAIAAPNTLTTPGTFSAIATPREEYVPLFADQPEMNPPAAPSPPNEYLSPTSSEGFYDLFSTQFAWGNRGRQRYHFGWYSYDDVVWLPPASTHAAMGTFSNLEMNTWIRYASQLDSQWVFTGTGYLNNRFFSGPQKPMIGPETNLLGLDLQWANISQGPVGGQFAVTGWINSDFNHGLTSNAIMGDVRGVAIFQLAPQLQVAVGAAYWDRVRRLAIPYGGIVWTPDENWELRLFFPKTRISRHLGAPLGIDTWFFASGEYNVEAYQMRLAETGLRDRMEQSDYRLSIGVNGERGGYSVICETGVVLDRRVRFRSGTSDFGIGDNWFLRIGLLF